MKSETFKLRRSEAALGAEITGIDLAQPISTEIFNKIENAFNENIVVVFRGQNLGPEQLIQFSRQFGELEVNINSKFSLPNHPEVLLVSNIVENGSPIGLIDAGRTWHTDMSYTLNPPRCSLLHAKEIPVQDGVSLGDTLFVSTVAAYEALPEDKKEKLDGLKAIHRFSAKMAARRKTKGTMREISEKEMQIPDVVHPVIRTHPITGKKSIYVSDGECVGIPGMPDNEALDLIKELSDFCQRDEFMYRHKWQPGDLLMWDNCMAQHLAVQDYALPQRRLMLRTTVNGTIPF